MLTSDVLVVGAGPAGLAVGACLRRAGLEPTLLERGERVGWSWHGHYDRLHLHTVKQHSALPRLDFPADVPRYPSRRQVVEYLERYARAFDLAPRLGEEAQRVYRADDGWHCETTRAHHLAPDLVIATGVNRRPVVPSWPGQERFGGTLRHSSAYRNAEPYRGRRVLVVGMGNSGAEIALDLAEGGAAPTVALRGRLNVVPRDFGGRPVQVTSIRTAWLPTAVRDRIGRVLSRAAFGDLERYGVRTPPYGPIVQIERLARVPVIDVGTVAAIKAGRIAVAPGLSGFTAGGVLFDDRRERPFDDVILATGYRPEIAELVEGVGPALDGRGVPRREAGDVPGLYFLGFALAPTGALRAIGRAAPRIATAILRRRGAR